MTVRTLKKRLTDRRLSGIPFRRTSSDIDASESHNRTRTRTRRTTTALRSSFQRSFTFSKRNSDSDTTAPTPERTAAQKHFLLRRPSFKSSISSDPTTTTDATSSSSSLIDPATQALATNEAEHTRKAFRQSLPSSLLQAHDDRDIVAPFQPQEIILENKLGSGEFSDVYEVASIQFQHEFAEDEELSCEELNKRLRMKKYEKYRETKNARYALKHIKEGYYLGDEDSERYVQAASDLALEAEFLASLQHPNIIKLRGINYSGAAGFADGPRGYFLIIDRLSETLGQRMKKWHFQSKRAASAFSRRMSFSSDVNYLLSSEEISDQTEKENGIKEEQFNTAFQISAAMAYLHENSIIFRDLKPENIGFDVRGDVKIFDFGLARIMPNNGDPYNDTFDMSGAGSPRYMAPECLNCIPYNMKADVYTFAIIVWEMLSGSMPYEFVRTRYQLIHYVVEENGRPEIDESWPASIQGMLESSFDSEIEKRPKMKLWYNILREVLVSLHGGSRDDLQDTFVNRRRSNESMIDMS